MDVLMDVEALVNASCRGDARAFEALVRAQAGRLHRIAWRVTSDEDLADDVVQETFLRILRVPAAARPTRAAAAWLARVTVRVALNIVDGEKSRRRRESRYAKERSQEMKDGASSPGASAAELGRPVATALASLSPETRAALWLHVVEGEGVREIAACLDSSRSAVSRRIRAGLASLRLRLAKGGVAVAGVASLRASLHGGELLACETLVARVIEASGPALSTAATSMGTTPAASSSPSSPSPASPSSSAGRDLLDAALARPLRRPLSAAAMGAAAIVLVGVVAVLIAIGQLRRSPTGRLPIDAPTAPVAVAPDLEAPPVAAASADGVPASAEPAPAPAAPATARLGGTIRDERGEPVARADVYLAISPVREEDLLGSLGSYLRADHFDRSRFFRTATDEEGRYRFDGIDRFGDGRLGVYREGHSDPHNPGSRGLETVRLEAGTERSDVDLVLPTGKTLEGRVLATDGAPLSDAIVTVTTAWSAKSPLFWPAGLSPTDSEGRFRLGISPAAVGCHLRVNSVAHGQDFFVEVPVSDGPVELTLKDFARVEGAITWTDGAAASGLTVRVTGRLPEPPIPVSITGLRSHVVHDGRVGDDGRYVIEGVHPGLACDIFIIDESLGIEEARKKPLVPQLLHTFRLEPGEVKVWDHTLSRPLTVRGRIVTAASRRPVLEAQVFARKGSKTNALQPVWADADGRYELTLAAGPGEYRIHAQPPVGDPESDEIDRLIDERFGRTVYASGREALEVDLEIFEPVVLPLRVLDADGEPAESFRGMLHVVFPGGETQRFSWSRSLDETGRTSLRLYHPARELWCELAVVENGPAAATAHHAGQPGVELPEETVVLPRTCSLVATAVDPSGERHGERWLRLRALYDDGSSADLLVRTDELGVVKVADRLRASGLVVELRAADGSVLWRSPRHDGRTTKVIDLGEIVIERDDG